MKTTLQTAIAEGLFPRQVGCGGAMDSRVRGNDGYHKLPRGNEG
jgi:hypothetical protein